MDDRFEAPYLGVQQEQIGRALPEARKDALRSWPRDAPPSDGIQASAAP